MSAVLWIDSSVARKPAQVRELGERARRHAVALRVHPIVHFEQCRQVRAHGRAAGRAFDPVLMESFLGRYSIAVADVPMSRANAESWAERIDGWFPTNDAWREAKRAALHARLPEHTKLDAEAVPSTVDWLIALAVEDAPDVRIAVEDKGAEWKTLRAANRALSFPDALAWVASLPARAP